MATIVEMINPLTGLPEQADKLDHTAQEIDDAVGLAPQLSNPNLLDNWYFGNPVNQRGQTESTGADYWIDRWRRYQSSSTGIITDDGVQMTSDGSKTMGLQQRISASQLIAGFTYTFSVLLKCLSDEQDSDNYNIGLSYGLNADSNTYSSWIPKTQNLDGFTVFSWTFTLVASLGGVYNFRIRSGTSGPVSYVIKAMKLELGSQQTLAHQDENGVWQLNEIPDYGEQLVRCQRYFQLYSSADKRPAKDVDCRPVMRTDPSQGTIVIGSTTYYYNTADL